MTLEIGPSLINLRNTVVKFGQGAFFAYASGVTAVAHGVASRLDIDTELIDMCGWFDGDIYTPKQPGYYLLFAQANIVATDAADFTDGTDIFQMAINKNGTAISNVRTMQKGNTLTRIVIMEANGTTDYFTVTASFTGSAGESISIRNATFGGVFVSFNNP